MEINLEENGGGLNLYNNPIKSPPLEIIKQGRQAVLEWFAAKKVKLNEIKIILIGDPKAGKTSLLRRLKDDSFNQEEAQTDGVNIEDIQFGACQTFQAQTILHPITGHFWDFGGQEIMNATHQFFLTRRSVYILVLDARKDDHVAAQIRQWLKRVSATGGNSPVLVVANQIDINSGFGFENEYELQREFPQVKYFIKASCATGEKIGFIKEKLAELIPEAEFFQTTEIDERWMALKDALQQETKPKHFLNEDRFIELCRQCGLIKPSERRYAINFLHDLGIVLHFEAIKRYDYYVLDPFWITYGVYQILTSALAGANNGMVGMDQLEYIINEEPDKKERYRPTGEAKIEYTNQQSRFLLEILNQFKLCFRLPDDSRFIIPDLLDTDEPEELTGPIRNAVGSLRFVYDYDYLPKFIMPRIIVETHRVHAKIWRTGCVLKNNDCLALISNYQNRISIAVTGEDKKKWEFMSVIRFLIDSINRELSDPPNMLIPLPGTNEFADYEELLEREKDRETYYTLYKPVKRKFEISLLLQGVASRDEVRIISEKLDLLDRKFDTMLSKLDAHFDYLIELPANRDVKAEIAAAVAELKLQPSPDLVEDIIAGISAALDQSTAKMDRRLNEILADWQQTDQVGMKLKLAVPLLNLIGLQLETEFDVKKWAAQMVQKHKNKQIFHTILEARARSLGRDEIE
ncbi:MAG: GTP-binding protein [Calditrichae bacterium]|nr:GTP-binding protein [Calditrichia bacterium]